MIRYTRDDPTSSIFAPFYLFYIFWYSRTIEISNDFTMRTAQITSLVIDLVLLHVLSYVDLVPHSLDQCETLLCKFLYIIYQ